MVQQGNSVVPPLYFGPLSYTPIPGFTGHMPGVDNVPPGYSYRDNLRTAREDAIWANANNPQSWQPLSGLGNTLKSKRHDPVLKGTEVDFDVISSKEGLMPGYTGHIPHLKSNGFPGHTYKHLTRNTGALARSDCREIAYLTEQKQALQECARQDRMNQLLAQGVDPQDSADSHLQTDYTSPIELSASEMEHVKGVWLEFHSKMEEHHKLPSVAFRKIDDEHKGYITEANVKRMMDLMGMHVSPLQVRVVMKGLGCDPRGRVTVMDFRRASELALPDALQTFSGRRPLYTPRDTVRRGGGGGGEPGQEPKRLRTVKSVRSKGGMSGSLDSAQVRPLSSSLASSLGACRFSMELYSLSEEPPDM